mmetsp:Transcript_39873/g.35577  ORF Transcript_39873/g.35577 Transcript_39873/m.35577 type:complete len:144 (-) Transcript_39873:643-1074(-)
MSSLFQNFQPNLLLNSSSDMSTSNIFSNQQQNSRVENINIVVDNLNAKTKKVFQQVPIEVASDDSICASDVVNFLELKGLSFNNHFILNYNLSMKMYIYLGKREDAMSKTLYFKDLVTLSSNKKVLLIRLRKIEQDLIKKYYE